MKKSWKNPGMLQRIHMKLELSIEINDHERHKRPWQFSDSQITVRENLYFDLKKYWKSTGICLYETMWKPRPF